MDASHDAKIVCLTGVTQKPGMERCGPAPTALRRAGWPGGSGIGGAPAAATERLCYRAAAGYMFVCECICICVVSEGVQTRRLSSTSQSLAGWPVACGGVRQALLLQSCALAAALVAAGQDGRQLLLALAGDAGDAHDALLRRRLGC